MAVFDITTPLKVFFIISHLAAPRSILDRLWRKSLPSTEVDYSVVNVLTQKAIKTCNEVLSP